MKGPLKEAGRVLSSVGCETCPTEASSDCQLIPILRIDSPHPDPPFFRSILLTPIQNAYRSIYFLIDPYLLTFPLVGVLIHPFSRPQPKPNPSEENPRLVS